MTGLLRGVARTAVAAGTATAVANRVSRLQAGRWAHQEQSPSRGAASQTPPDAPVEDSVAAKIDQLKQLGDLRDRGLLTDAEFAEQKARLLAS
ncbi:SHOCT domain-containing protein [Peterkaempfera griseoplana]|uniref:SHOCT domain-containing protein n=1 Tax=Peterkaempfera griseoplana TaxID=66896 RepID=UPI0006E18892|nr:SHOCT domain-containing protein [Peterkaempfera griseoplana]